MELVTYLGNIQDVGTYIKSKHNLHKICILLMRKKINEFYDSNNMTKSVLMKSYGTHSEMKAQLKFCPPTRTIFLNLLSDLVHPMGTLFLIFSASNQILRGSKYSAIALPLILRSPLNASIASGQGFEAPIDNIALQDRKPG